MKAVRPHRFTRYQRALLRRLRAGEMLEHVRAFPRPHRLCLQTEDGATAIGASERVLASLLRHDVLQPVPVDAAWDRIRYALTPAGAQRVARMRRPRPVVPRGRA